MASDFDRAQAQRIIKACSGESSHRCQYCQILESAIHLYDTVHDHNLSDLLRVFEPVHSSRVPHPAEVVARVQELRAAHKALKGEHEKLNGRLDAARAVMIRAMDALEADGDVWARRQAFEMIQEQFEGVPTEDHDRAEGLITFYQAQVEGGEDSRNDDSAPSSIKRKDTPEGKAHWEFVEEVAADTRQDYHHGR